MVSKIVQNLVNYQKIASQKQQMGVQWTISERRWKKLTYVFGALAGLVFGALVGHLKNNFIWKKYLKRGSNSAAAGSEATALYSRLITSNIVNVLTLVIAFLLIISSYILTQKKCRMQKQTTPNKSDFRFCCDTKFFINPLKRFYLTRKGTLLPRSILFNGLNFMSQIYFIIFLYLLQLIY
jgi:hypothetical protein